MGWKGGGRGEGGWKGGLVLIFIYVVYILIEGKQRDRGGGEDSAEWEEDYGGY